MTDVPQIEVAGAGLGPEEVAALVAVLSALGVERRPPPPVPERAVWRLPASGGALPWRPAAAVHQPYATEGKGHD